VSSGRGVLLRGRGRSVVDSGSQSPLGIEWGRTGLMGTIVVYVGMWVRLPIRRKCLGGHLC